MSGLADAGGIDVGAAAARSWTVRLARLDDIDALVAFRRRMFVEIGHDDPEGLARMAESCGRYFEETLPTGEHVGWVADADGVTIATGGLVVYRLPPSVKNPDGRHGYIMNICTLPESRRKGVASSVIEAILGHLRERGIPVATLHASPEGREVYERLGFESHPSEMRLFLEESSGPAAGMGEAGMKTESPSMEEAEA